MKFIPKFLRARAPAREAADSYSPLDHIDRALRAAGLGDASAAEGIRNTIDRALEAAGLQTRTSMPGDHADTVASPSEPCAGHRAPDTQTHGQFLRATFANAHGRRDYRLYLPIGYDANGLARPLLLMLHGCTQSAEDFAVGTRMNALADTHGFLVAYPQQIGKANHAKCWNWFRPEDQRGDAGEPSILAGIAEQVAQHYRVDARRIFVAGLSAGAAMAVVLGTTRPDLVRAIGVHSGLPYASAHDVPSAFAAMQGRGTNARASQSNSPVVPMIVFHGDEDRTVAPSNADALTASAARPGAHRATETGRSSGGRSYTRDVIGDAHAAFFERWTVHGAGHAWSGGDAAGTYTDRAGPDASSAMVDFFLHLGG